MQEDILLVDEFLVERNETAFRQLYRSSTPAVYQLALRLSPNQQEAEDLVQKAWIVAIEKIDKFQRRSTFKTWLTGILINLCKEMQRKHAVHVNSIDDDNSPAQNRTASGTADKIDLENAIRSLSPGYREVLILHDIEGYTHKEIGELLEISSGTSKSQLFQARKILRTQLFDNYKTQ